MATLNVRRFSDPDFLRLLAPEDLLLLLEPHRAHLERRGWIWPDSPLWFEVGYLELAAILMAPSAETPPELAECLHAINEMSTERAMDRLLAVASRKRIDLGLGEQCAPSEVAARMWLHHRRLFDAVHTEIQLTRLRSFEFYQCGIDPVPAIDVPSEAALATMAEELDVFFRSRKRGRGTKVVAFDRADGLWLVVRHGEVLRREGCLRDDGQSDSILYRPLSHDVFVVNRATGELGIHTESRSIELKDLYRSQLGLLLFGQPHAFHGGGKYTLEPLRRVGRQALACVDIDGIEEIVLTEVQQEWLHGHERLRIEQAGDLFAAFEADGAGWEAETRLRQAKFSVHFTGVHKPRIVTICPPNRAVCQRDGDTAVVERWLAARGFISAGYADVPALAS